MARAKRVVHAESFKWYIPECDQEDILQSTITNVIQYWKPPAIKDPEAYYLSCLHMQARSVVMRLKGYHNGKKRPQQLKAAGEEATSTVGLYQPTTEGDTLLLDERILPTMPSAEDVYLATVPSKRETALREAVDSLPDRQRVVLTHQFYEELSVAESASALGLTISEVSSLRSNALRALKRKLNA